MSNLLKCPRCSTRFDAESAVKTPSGHVICTNCSARLRFRARPAVAAPQDVGPQDSSADSVSASGDLAFAGLNDRSATASSDASAPSGATSGTGSSNGSREPDATLPPGTRLGGFEVRRVLGRGGMATVYKATQLSLNRPVAVKVLARRFSKSRVFVDRFDQEAGALAGLNHPNIVNIIDKGVIDDHYFFVMEIVEGITLDQLLHSVELTEQHYLHIIGEISKALTYVHSRGIIHRDIKPSNILVNRQGAVKVGDFGIAHMTDAETPTDGGARKGTVGTAHYMSPEQASDPASVDQRADVYSLAVTFYKMFTRHLPPPGATTVTPPSELNLALPRNVDTIIAKAMNPDPARRYPEVGEFCDALTNAFVSRAGAGSSQAGADASSSGSVTESGSSLFNTTLFTSLPSSSSSGSGFGLSTVAAPSQSSELVLTALDSGTNTSLGAPLSIPGLDSTETSTSGLAAVSPSSLSLDSSPSYSPTFYRPEAPPAAVAEVESGSSRKRLYVILGIVLAIVGAGVAFGLIWWLHYSAYGSIL